MSELIESRIEQASIRRRLLATVSALVLTAYVATSQSRAEETDRPTVWIELGGQMEKVEGASSPFFAPFMSKAPTPGPYHGDIFGAGQKSSNKALGFDGKVSFQQENSDWIFSIAARFGRSHADRALHQQTALVAPGLLGNYAAPYAQITSSFKESHTVLDFTAGRDIGIGAFGREGHSTLSAGVRFAQFSDKSKADAFARPTVIPNVYYGIVIFPSFTDYAMNAYAERSFRGIGPSLSWDASATLLGNHDGGEVTLDWGVNASLLFGRQRTTLDDTTQASHRPGTLSGYYFVTTVYQSAHPASRSRRVTVPNLGGFAGFSVKYPNAKISLGYRGDFFFGAMDTGTDIRKTSTVGFYGPFATVSIGLGG